MKPLGDLVVLGALGALVVSLGDLVDLEALVDLGALEEPGALVDLGALEDLGVLVDSIGTTSGALVDFIDFGDLVDLGAFDDFTDLGSLEDPGALVALGSFDDFSLGDFVCKTLVRLRTRVFLSAATERTSVIRRINMEKDFILEFLLFIKSESCSSRGNRRLCDGNLVLQILRAF